MKKLTTVFYLSIIIIVSGIVFFFFLEKGEKLRIAFLAPKEGETVQLTQSSLIHQEIQTHTQLSIHEIDYLLKYYQNTLDFESHLKSIIKSGVSDVIVCKFNNEELLNAFSQSNEYASSFFITLYNGHFEVSDNKNNVLNILPLPKLVANAINQLFDINPTQSVLVISEINNKDQMESFLLHLDGKKESIFLNERADSENLFNSMGKTLSEINPDFLIINLKEKNTIDLLEHIVGFPRNKIILLIENSSERVRYYSGSNVYGVNGITLANPTGITDFNNENSLLSMISNLLAQLFLQNQPLDSESLKSYLKKNPQIPLRIEGNQIYTPFYLISFSEEGLNVLSKLD
ncbi:MAG TPA: hypothetical protein PLI77_05040 [Bacteroidales bacterium]|nr:hypothetical protein [Bacteroidales bacterium]HRW33585.1 hypothetical protein [Thermotogota bacterium]